MGRPCPLARKICETNHFGGHLHIRDLTSAAIQVIIRAHYARLDGVALFIRTPGRGERQIPPLRQAIFKGPRVLRGTEALQ